MSESHVEKLILKVLYTVDNEVSPYLSRSTFPVPVKVVRFSKEMQQSNSTLPASIGVAYLYDVLNQVYSNSPELFNILTSRVTSTTTSGGNSSRGKNTSGSNSGRNAQKHVESVLQDFNVYYKDIIETDEPYVSLGLLSNLQSVKTPTDDPRMNSDEYYDSQVFQDPNSPLVMGRICKNFTSFMRASNTTATSNSTGKTYTNDILELKLRFSRVGSSSTSTSSSSSIQNAQTTMAGSASRRNSTVAKTQSSNATSPYTQQQQAGVPVKPVPTTTTTTRKTKRVTNPRPAPKATKTQSLPIWNSTMVPPSTVNAQKRGPSSYIMKKIQQNDQKTEETGFYNNEAQKYTQEQQQQQPVNNIYALSNNYNYRDVDTQPEMAKTPGTVDVSKRFDFASKLRSSNNNKNTTQSSPTNGLGVSMTKRKVTNKKKQPTATSAASTYTMKKKKVIANSVAQVALLSEDDEQDDNEFDEFDIPTNIIDNPESKDSFSPLKGMVELHSPQHEQQELSHMASQLPILEEEHIEFDFLTHTAKSYAPATKKRNIANSNKMPNKKRKTQDSQGNLSIEQLIVLDKENIIPPAPANFHNPGHDQTNQVATTTGLLLPDIDFDEFFDKQIFPMDLENKAHAGDHHSQHQEVLDIDLGEDDDEDEDEDSAHNEGKQWFLNEFLSQENDPSTNNKPTAEDFALHNDEQDQDDKNTPQIVTPSGGNTHREDLKSTGKYEHAHSSSFIDGTEGSNGADNRSSNIFSSSSSSKMAQEYMDDFTSATSNTNTNSTNTHAHPAIDLAAYTPGVISLAKKLKNRKIMPSSPPMMSSNKNDDSLSDLESDHHNQLYHPESSSPNISTSCIATPNTIGLQRFGQFAEPQGIRKD